MTRGMIRNKSFSWKVLILEFANGGPCLDGIFGVMECIKWLKLSLLNIYFWDGFLFSSFLWEIICNFSKYCKVGKEQCYVSGVGWNLVISISSYACVWFLHGWPFLVLLVCLTFGWNRWCDSRCPIHRHLGMCLGLVKWISPLYQITRMIENSLDHETTSHKFHILGNELLAFEGV